jgi:hypothetical protein
MPGSDPLTGRERRLRETAKTYDAAEVALTRLQDQVDEDRRPKTNITVGRAIQQWLDVVRLEPQAGPARACAGPTTGDPLVTRFISLLVLPAALPACGTGRAMVHTRR